MSVTPDTPRISAERWLHGMVRRVAPSGLRRVLRRVAGREEETVRELRRFGRQLRSIPCAGSQVLPLLHYRVRVHHGEICYHLYRDIFVNRIYHFESQRLDPLILDCGSNMGMSILYFKYVYPQARIIGFEPDPALFPHLQENISLNRLADVELHQVAVAGREGRLALHSDGLIGSSLAAQGAGIPDARRTQDVPVVRLRDFLREPVDFLKMNIEGAEWEALQDSQECLRQVREMVIEYHHLPGLPRTLHNILDLLDRLGYEYVVSDFGMSCYGLALPPVRLQADTRYFRHIYACRRA